MQLGGRGKTDLTSEAVRDAQLGLNSAISTIDARLLQAFVAGNSHLVEQVLATLVDTHSAVEQQQWKFCRRMAAAHVQFNTLHVQEHPGEYPLVSSELIEAWREVVDITRAEDFQKHVQADSESYGAKAFIDLKDKVDTTAKIILVWLKAIEDRVKNHPPLSDAPKYEQWSSYVQAVAPYQLNQTFADTFHCPVSDVRWEAMKVEHLLTIMSAPVTAVNDTDLIIGFAKLKSMGNVRESVSYTHLKLPTIYSV